MLADLITSKSRVTLLTVFLSTPEEMYHVRECVRRTEEEINAVPDAPPETPVEKVKRQRK